MPTKFLSLMLAVTQFLSWTAMPLYLCVASDGSVCVDLGQASCTCCQGCEQKHDDHDACGSTCQSERHPPTSVAVVDQAGTCDCTHIPLLAQQSDLVRTLVIVAWDVGWSSMDWTNVTSEFVLAANRTPLLHGDHEFDPSPHLAVIATTVLRC